MPVDGEASETYKQLYELSYLKWRHCQRITLKYEYCLFNFL